MSNADDFINGKLMLIFSLRMIWENIEFKKKKQNNFFFILKLKLTKSSVTLKSV